MSHLREELIDAAGRDYRCLVRRDQGGYVITCPHLPPMIAWGDTLPAARAEAHREIEAWLRTIENMAADADTSPDFV